ncbi:hypothetical protein ACFY1P_29665 [Streptomyces sp. NPDC001407]|uniref:hypothetical protein n=1 Tax=unclassified Streptomyces TaxID=2593676 RepID=UPI0036ACDDFC
MAERLGQMIVEQCNWRDVAVQWVGNEQARLVPKEGSWWIGITMLGAGVQMWAGRIRNDGTPADPTTQSGQLFASDHEAVVEAARRLRAQVE